MDGAGGSGVLCGDGCVVLGEDEEEEEVAVVAEVVDEAVVECVSVERADRMWFAVGVVVEAEMGMLVVVVVSVVVTDGERDDEDGTCRCCGC